MSSSPAEPVLLTGSEIQTFLNSTFLAHMEAASSPAPNQAKPVLYKSGVAGGNWGSKEKGVMADGRKVDKVLLASLAALKAKPTTNGTASAKK